MLYGLRDACYAAKSDWYIPLASNLRLTRLFKKKNNNNKNPFCSINLIDEKQNHNFALCTLASKPVLQVSNAHSCAYEI